MGPHHRRSSPSQIGISSENSSLAESCTVLPEKFCFDQGSSALNCAQNYCTPSSFGEILLSVESRCVFLVNFLRQCIEKNEFGASHLGYFYCGCKS